MALRVSMVVCVTFFVDKNGLCGIIFLFKGSIQTGLSCCCSDVFTLTALLAVLSENQLLTKLVNCRNF